MTSYIEIDWAEDGAGLPIPGPVGPFESDSAADAWARRTICNGEWQVARLISPLVAGDVEVAGR